MPLVADCCKSINPDSPDRFKLSHNERTGFMPKWRNGRRDGLKHRWGQPRVGSTPTFGTN